MTSEEWLKHIPPGTMFYERGKPGFYLVYHVVVEEFPGPFRLLNIWCVDSARCRLTKLSVESESFRHKWAIVDVD